MGYEIVVLMLIVAVVAVLIAYMAETPSPSPLPDPSDDQGHLVWAALGSGITPARDSDDRPWTVQVASAYPTTVTLLGFGAPSSTLDEARRHDLRPLLQAKPNIVTIWLVVSDLLRGTRLTDYEQSLSAILGQLTQEGRHIVIGNLPDLSNVPAISEAAGDAEALALTIAAWNGAIARIANVHNARVADLTDLDPVAAFESMWFTDEGFRLAPVGNQQVAALFRPAVDDALRSCKAVPER